MTERPTPEEIADEVVEFPKYDMHDRIALRMRIAERIREEREVVKDLKSTIALQAALIRDLKGRLHESTRGGC